MLRTIRCLVMVMLLLAAAVPALRAQEVPASGAPAAESPDLWTGFVSWVSALFTGGGPFIDPNGGSRAAPADRDGGDLAQDDRGGFARPRG